MEIYILLKTIFDVAYQVLNSGSYLLLLKQSFFNLSIKDNVIRGNQWGGVDIRNGSCPLVAGNSIINGLSDGIVVGLSGRGSIESNFISGECKNKKK